MRSRILRNREAEDELKSAKELANDIHYARTDAVDYNWTPPKWWEKAMSDRDGWRVPGSGCISSPRDGRGALRDLSEDEAARLADGAPREPRDRRADPNRNAGDPRGLLWEGHDRRRFHR